MLFATALTNESIADALALPQYRDVYIALAREILAVAAAKAVTPEAFNGFDPRRVARYDSRRIKKLLADPGIVRNRLKIASTIGNAKAFLRVQDEFGTFDRYIWQFVGGKPLINKRKSLRQVPARTPESDAMSKDLQRRGFKFVGSTICYAFMQAVGMVNDHVLDCFRYKLV